MEGMSRIYMEGMSRGQLAFESKQLGRDLTLANEKVKRLREMMTMTGRSAHVVANSLDEQLVLAEAKQAAVLAQMNAIRTELVLRTSFGTVKKRAAADEKAKAVQAIVVAQRNVVVANDALLKARSRQRAISRERRLHAVDGLTPQQREKARQVRNARSDAAANLRSKAREAVRLEAKKKADADKAAVVAWWAANEEKVSPYQTPINPPPEHSLFGPDSDEEKVSPYRAPVGRPPRYGLFEDDPDDEVNGGRMKRKTRRRKAKKSKNIHRKKSKGTRKKRRTRKGRR